MFFYIFCFKKIFVGYIYKHYFSVIKPETRH